MAVSDLALHETDHERLEAILARLLQDANARVTFLIDKNGQQLAGAGQLEQFDPTSLAALAAGNVAATDGLAKILGEMGFATLFHEGEHDHLHINVVGGKAILVVIFDERSSLGLVRLRVKQSSTELGSILEDIVARSRSQRTVAAGSNGPFAEITDDDIDALFG
jgi:predicted regulator of Ras-like GTPase activity (Roadblock/LC7/MglB family)